MERMHYILGKCCKYLSKIIINFMKKAEKTIMNKFIELNQNKIVTVSGGVTSNLQIVTEIIGGLTGINYLLHLIENKKVFSFTNEALVPSIVFASSTIYTSFRLGKALGGIINMLEKTVETWMAKSE